MYPNGCPRFLKKTNPVGAKPNRPGEPETAGRGHSIRANLYADIYFAELAFQVKELRPPKSICKRGPEAGKFFPLTGPCAHSFVQISMPEFTLMNIGIRVKELRPTESLCERNDYCLRKILPAYGSECACVCGNCMSILLWWTLENAVKELRPTESLCERGTRTVWKNPFTNGRDFWVYASSFAFLTIRLVFKFFRPRFYSSSK